MFTCVDTGRLYTTVLPIQQPLLADIHPVMLGFASEGKRNAR